MALIRLVKGGFVEAKLPVTVQFDQPPKRTTTIWRVTGNYSAVLGDAIRKYLHCGSTGASTFKIICGDFEQARLTADGELARQDFRGGLPAPCLEPADPDGLTPKLSYAMFSLVAGGPDGSRGPQPPGTALFDAEVPADAPVSGPATWPGLPFDPGCTRRVPVDSNAVAVIGRVIRDWDAQNWAVVREALLAVGRPADLLKSMTVFDIQMAFAVHRASMLAKCGEIRTTTPTIQTLNPSPVNAGHFDVILFHNSCDKPMVRDIASGLKSRGIAPWLDELHFRPGDAWQQVLERVIPTVPAAAVFIGQDGIGPWQQMEIDAVQREFAKRACRIIPVLLPMASRPVLPVFLRAFHWVDFGIAEPYPMDQLFWGITGNRPSKS